LMMGIFHLLGFWRHLTAVGEIMSLSFSQKNRIVLK